MNMENKFFMKLKNQIFIYCSCFLFFWVGIYNSFDLRFEMITVLDHCLAIGQKKIRGLRPQTPINNNLFKNGKTKNLKNF